MATIGTFTKNGDSYTGIITTLTLNVAVAVEPIADRKSDKSPNFRFRTADSGIEIGAAWNKTSREGAEYQSVNIDDPSFAAPIQCSLVKNGSDHSYKLIWDRPRGRD
ncbi:MAG TPA: DUF736 domain-containing protein [Bryobacteraceae bacterium]|nr:DUF736 domain-containing protein [Bryobacteraceae bacterium]